MPVGDIQSRMREIVCVGGRQHVTTAAFMATLQEGEVPVLLHLKTYERELKVVISSNL